MMGSFFVPGRELHLRDVPARPRIQRSSLPELTADPNGDFVVEQAYVQYVRLLRPRSRFPLLLWHGGSLSGSVYESTPDGRPGWQWDFLRAGYDVYTVDAPASGRAPFARYPEVTPTEPAFRSKQMLWETFRIGPLGSYRSEPTSRVSVPGTLFPVAAFDAFATQVVPSFPYHDEAIAHAMEAAIRLVGPCVLLTHSAAGPLGYACAAALPGLVMAHVAVEPSGGAPAGTDLVRLSRVPHLFVWGDGFEGAMASWQELVSGARATYEDLLERAAWMELPARGVVGNSHMLMLDTNSSEIADLIVGWLREHI